MRILFVAFTHSIHTVRWIRQLAGTGMDLHVLPSQWPMAMHRDLEDVTVHGVGLIGPASGAGRLRYAGVWPLRRGAYRLEGLVARHMPWRRERVAILTSVIRKLQPDIVHCMEMQSAGYLMSDCLKAWRYGRVPPWIYSCWGNDLYYFGRFPEHRHRIEAALRVCPYLIADCQRDVALAQTMGFAGEALGVYPTGGGFPIREYRERVALEPTSQRRVIALKGYHDDDWAGRALVALQAVQACADVLKDYEIVIYLAKANVRFAAEYVARVTGLKITVLPEVGHDRILELMAQSRLAIASSITDGTPNAMLEAMMMGAFPIQSDTVSPREWIQSGHNGYLVSPEDPGSIAAAIRLSLRDDGLVDRAAAANLEALLARIDSSVIQPQIVDLYNRIASKG